MQHDQHSTSPATVQPEIFFTPTPARVIVEMLRLAEVGPQDVMYDLGSGDGRVLIAAAKEKGARGVGVEIDASLVAHARANAEAAGVADRLTFVQQNFFETDLSGASVLTLYLLDSLNLRLRPKIFAECSPGARVVTYSFEMGEWEPDAHTPMAANGVSLWIVPANVSGEWRAAGAIGGSGLEKLIMEQRFQKLSGSAVLRGGERRPVGGKVLGARFIMEITGAAGAPPVRLVGRVDGDLIDAAVEASGAAAQWQACREQGTAQESITAGPGGA